MSDRSNLKVTLCHDVDNTKSALSNFEDVSSNLLFEIETNIDDSNSANNAKEEVSELIEITLRNALVDSFAANFCQNDPKVASISARSYRGNSLTGDFCMSTAEESLSCDVYTIILHAIVEKTNDSNTNGDSGNSLGTISTSSPVVDAFGLENTFEETLLAELQGETQHRLILGKVNEALENNSPTIVKARAVSMRFTGFAKEQIENGSEQDGWNTTVSDGNKNDVSDSSSGNGSYENELNYTNGVDVGLGAGVSVSVEMLGTGGNSGNEIIDENSISEIGNNLMPFNDIKSTETVVLPAAGDGSNNDFASDPATDISQLNISVGNNGSKSGITSGTDENGNSIIEGIGSSDSIIKDGIGGNVGSDNDFASSPVADISQLNISDGNNGSESGITGGTDENGSSITSGINTTGSIIIDGIGGNNIKLIGNVLPVSSSGNKNESDNNGLAPLEIWSISLVVILVLFCYFSKCFRYLRCPSCKHRHRKINEVDSRKEVDDGGEDSESTGEESCVGGVRIMEEENRNNENELDGAYSVEVLHNESEAASRATSFDDDWRNYTNNWEKFEQGETQKEIKPSTATKYAVEDPKQMMEYTPENSAVCGGCC